MALSFIIVDNAELDQYVAHQLITRTAGDDAVVDTFFTAEEALEHITGQTVQSSMKSIILLDLMMPQSDGYSFIRDFEMLPPAIQENYRIVIVTSSLDKSDLERLRNSKIVHALVEKPFTREKMDKLLKQLGTSKL
jgi:CheY-like chemotaxis protein